MSSDSSILQSRVTALQQYNYLSLAMLTVIGYDYMINFAKEVEYIWLKPWNWVTLMFVMVRYGGIYSYIPPTISALLYIIGGWTYILFLIGADVAMILRIWVLYNRSRLIFVALIPLFAAEIVVTIVDIAINIPSNLSDVAGTQQVLDYSTCFLTYPPSSLGEAADALQIANGAILCAFAIVQFARQSLQMYRITKRWEINRFISLLVKQGVLYFIALFLYNVIGFAQPTTAAGGITLTILQYVPAFTLTPRFIINMREMYARDVRGGIQANTLNGGGGMIDSGFGLSTFSAARGSGGGGGEDIEFADVAMEGGSY